MSGPAPHEARRRAIKIAFGELIGKIGGIEAAAGFTRVGKSTLARYYSLAPADAECFPPADVIDDLERVAGDPIVTRMMARGQDYLLLRDVQAGSVSIIDLHAAIANCAKEHGDAVASLLSALTDLALTPAEARRVIREMDEELQAHLRLRALVAQVAESE
ncbi:hypothetical protein [Sphingomonas sp. ID0503]|uniref:hypothetical protein n=1 Tax=Sphingomonas sp. ID0503 TaxID=3399691 RepID=UPI003AFA05D5